MVNLDIFVVALLVLLQKANSIVELSELILSVFEALRGLKGGDGDVPVHNEYSSIYKTRSTMQMEG